MQSTKNSEYVCNHIKKRKKDLTLVLGGKCCICGFDNYIEALEFHHINPSTKDFGITSSNSVTKSLEKQLVELKKCALVCANCHRGIHAGYLTLPDNVESLWDEDKAQELIEENYALRFGQEKKCQRCGKKITRKATYCQECANLLQRKADRPSREELKQLIRTTPFTTLGRNFGVTDNAIRKWCIEYNLPSKKKDINSISDIEWERI